jgi:(1->4)-alpha-D-glucan 1-alpha-D-glucosylmutase
MNPSRVPSATYRIQFSLGFRFADARELVPYLHELGITDLYASPRFKARRGSSHGYDVADPMRVNSEVGTEREFEELIQKLKHYQMDMLLDIVPNHMVASHENPWWMDVLENGSSSAYANYFDIDWHPATTKAAFLQENKVLLPILGNLYGNVLENQEITLRIDEKGFFASYGDARLPLDVNTYRFILQDCLEKISGQGHLEGQTRLELEKVLKAIEALPPRNVSDSTKIRKRQRAKEAIKQQLWVVYQSDLEFKTALDQTLRSFNGTKGDASSFDRLDQLLAEQAYRLAYWKIAYEEINYRRFFDINDLVGLRVEDPQVFEARHAQIFNLIRSGQVSGLRIDHVDGLLDPVDYLQRLQARAREEMAGKAANDDLYVVVEKILVEGEPLPPAWPVCGTTGYDFLNASTGVLVDINGLHSLAKAYERFSGCKTPFVEMSFQCKKRVMRDLFAGEVEALGHYLGGLAAQDRHARDVPLAELVHALVETTAHLPVYRTYVRDFDLDPRDRSTIEGALAEAQKHIPESVIGPPAFAFLRQVLLLEPPHYSADQKTDWLKFVMRWQQFTGPVMAKGFEDTALYVYPRLVSMNDVGGNPGTPGMSLEEFHRFLCDRQRLTPGTLNATSTHDAKRSEDVRARINVLSEISGEWEKCLRRWSGWNQSKKQKVNGAAVPDPNEEILLYQTLLGAWPFDQEEVPAFRERVRDYMIKAAREAKANTSWLLPNQEYEDALLRFTEQILTGRNSQRFLKDFLRLQKVVSHFGVFNGLSQVLLKITAPGVPDFYQGNELWEFSMVDPDNRRPVDFRKRTQLLELLKRREIEGRTKLMREMLHHWQDGRIKLYATYKALGFRKVHQDMFLKGEYIPLEVQGSQGAHVCAFARREGDDWVVIAVPRLLSRLIKVGEFPLGEKVWGSAKLVLPSQAPKNWVDTFTHEPINARATAKNKFLPLRQIFKSFPVTLLSNA